MPPQPASAILFSCLHKYLFACPFTTTPTQLHHTYLVVRGLGILLHIPNLLAEGSCVRARTRKELPLLTQVVWRRRTGRDCRTLHRRWKRMLHTLVHHTALHLTSNDRNENYTGPFITPTDTTLQNRFTSVKHGTARERSAFLQAHAIL